LGEDAAELDARHFTGDLNRVAATQFLHAEIDQVRSAEEFHDPEGERRGHQQRRQAYRPGDGVN
jgi:hypothetical protein